MQPYYADDLVTLYHGDCREVTEWLTADVLVTDPPYGRGWGQHGTSIRRGWRDDSHSGIANDADTAVRDSALALWGDVRGALVFGDFLSVPAGPSGDRQRDAHVCVAIQEQMADRVSGALLELQPW